MHRSNNYSCTNYYSSPDFWYCNKQVIQGPFAYGNQWKISRRGNFVIKPLKGHDLGYKIDGI